MKRLLVVFFLLLTIFGIKNKNVQASCSCTSGCSVGTCEEVVGPPASCEPSCGSGYEAKPWGAGCVKLQCSCGNVTSTTCCPVSPPPPPPPNGTPIPTAIPTATPTPVQQPAMIITPMVTPTTAPFLTGVTGQQWVCLKSTPCLNNAQCLEQSGHRVRISATEHPLLKLRKKTYIFDCLEFASDYRCTTGYANLDKSLLGIEYLTNDLAGADYQFLTLVDSQNQPIDQRDPNQVRFSDDYGNLGPFEWESRTKGQMKHVFYAMTPLSSIDQASGGGSGLKQGTFEMVSLTAETTCVKIQWDPHGVVFDSKDLKPLRDVLVEIFKKDSRGLFIPVTESDVIGGVVNPQQTKDDGQFAFLVPNGIYRLTVTSATHVIDKNFRTNKYPNIYHGEEIKTEGRLELRNIAMRPKTFIDKLINFIKTSF